jgi:hypothetical protein
VGTFLSTKFNLKMEKRIVFTKKNEEKHETGYF